MVVSVVQFSTLISPLDVGVVLPVDAVEGELLLIILWRLIV